MREMAGVPPGHFHLWGGSSLEPALRDHGVHAALSMFMRPAIIMSTPVIAAPAVSDPWHFPRESLASSVVDTLESGMVNAITLFAPRRMGKTEFVCTDLAPLAAGASIG